MRGWLRIKDIASDARSSDQNKLKATLSWPHLIALGVGGIVGTGIYTLIGVGADRAGPAVLLAFVVAGVVCAASAFAYAELASSIPYTGGAYTYTYAAVGELVAWVVGWSLILEYSLVVSTVAVGWSAYATSFLDSVGLHIPFYLRAGIDQIDPTSLAHSAIFALPHLYGPMIGEVNFASISYGLVNLPAVLIVFVVAGMLMIGTKESATLNIILVVIKIAALLLFIIVALPHFDPENLHPFMPFGFVKAMYPDGIERGVMAAAAIIFFAFYGFDTIATAAEETKNPKSDLSIGILGSLTICIIVYVLVGLAAVGALDFEIFSKSAEPLAMILRDIGKGQVSSIVAAAAVVALPTVLMAFFFGQTRIFFVMGRDGLLPKVLSNVHRKSGTPIVTTVFTGLIIAIIAGVFRLDEIAALANAGTLVAFTAAGVCLLVLRITQPNLPRKFKTPLVWVVGPVAIVGCIYLFSSLPIKTQFYFLLWNILGLCAYFIYGFWKSQQRRQSPGH